MQRYGLPVRYDELSRVISEHLSGDFAARAHPGGGQSCAILTPKLCAAPGVNLRLTPRCRRSTWRRAQLRPRRVADLAAGHST